MFKQQKYGKQNSSKKDIRFLWIIRIFLDDIRRENFNYSLPHAPSQHVEVEHDPNHLLTEIIQKLFVDEMPKETEQERQVIVT